MTDLITQIREDMAAGTPGPWGPETLPPPYNSSRFEIYAETATYPMVCIVTGEDYGSYFGGDEDGLEHQQANARRIARVPLLEDMVLALSDTLNTMKGTISAQADIDAKKDARIAELEAALEPFADAANEADKWGYNDHNQAAVSVGECRAARAALHQKEAET